MATKRRVTFNSPVILGFVFLCVAERLISMATGGASTRLLFMTYHSSLLDPLTYVRFITHAIGHGSWNHLVSNMTYVLLLGPLLEEKYGSQTLLEIMVLTALACGIANYLLFWDQALCGASGICFAFILLSSVTGFTEGEIPLTFILVALFFLGQQVVEGLFVSDTVSNFSHIIGGAVGAAAGFALGNPTKRVQ